MGQMKGNNATNALRIITSHKNLPNTMRAISVGMFGTFLLLMAVWHQDGTVSSMHPMRALIPFFIACVFYATAIWLEIRAHNMLKQNYSDSFQSFIYLVVNHVSTHIHNSVVAAFFVFCVVGFVVSDSRHPDFAKTFTELPPYIFAYVLPGTYTVFWMLAELFSIGMNLGYNVTSDDEPKKKRG